MATVIDFGFGANKDQTAFTSGLDSRFRIITSAVGVRREIRSISSTWKESTPVALGHVALNLVVCRQKIPVNPIGNALVDFANLLAAALTSNDFSDITKAGGILLINEPSYVFAGQKYDFAEGEMICENNDALFVGTGAAIDYGTASIGVVSGFSYLSVNGRDILTIKQQEVKLR